METIDFNEVIRDPETISVVGGLLPVAASGVKGLMPAKIAPFLLNIDAANKYIEISLSAVYNAEIYNITIYRSGYVCLYQCAIMPYNPNESKVKYIGASVPYSKFYVDKENAKIYIDFSSMSTGSVCISPIGINNGIKSVQLKSSININEAIEITPTSGN